MRICLVFALFPALLAQETLVPTPVNQLKALVDFEGGPAGGTPRGWHLTRGKASIDSNVVHRGRYAVRLEGNASITLLSPVTYSGEFLTIRGFLKTEGASFAGLWIRADGNSGNPVGFDNMRLRDLHGTTDWKEYSVEIPLAFNGTYLYFGVLTEGGTVWADDLEVFIDGRPIWDAPQKEGP